MNSNIFAIARACHEANRAYCESRGDHSQDPWDSAPEWQKDSAMKGVQLIIDKPDTTPADSHASWFRQKLADGWAYGTTKNPEKKLHPCMVSYDELPVEQRAKDYLFGLTARFHLGLTMLNIPSEIAALLHAVPLPEPLPTSKTHGQIAYEGYFAKCGGKSLVSGAPLPTFAQQKPEIQEAWEAAAAAVLA